MPPNRGIKKHIDFLHSTNGTPCRDSSKIEACDSANTISQTITTPTNSGNIQIKFLNMNVSFLPTIANMFTVLQTHLRREKERLRALVEVIKRADYDVVCLQEMWNHRIRNKFLDMINAKYKPNEWRNHIHGERDENYYSICPQDIRKFSLVRMSTGLIILSKYPIVNATMWQYMSDSKGSDSFVQKGLLYVELNVQGQPVHLATTHLQAPPDAFPTWWPSTVKGSSTQVSRMLRFDQLMELDRQIKVIAALLEKHNKDRVNMLVCGDFNVPRGSEEYQEMLATLSNPTDVMYSFYPDADPHPEASELTGRGKMDYIFTWENGQQPFENNLVFDHIEFIEFHKRYPDVMSTPFSDHPGIEAILHIVPKPDVRL